MTRLTAEPATAGHNLTEETFLHYVHLMAAADAKLKEAQSARKALRKQAQGAGIHLGYMDAIRRMNEWERDEVQEFFHLQTQYAKWYRLGGVVGDQGEFLFGGDKPIEPVEHGAAYWGEKGWQAGITGKDATPPTECHPEFHQDFLHQWHKAQEKIASGMSAANNVVPLASAPKGRRAGSKKAQEVLDQAAADAETDKAEGNFDPNAQGGSDETPPAGEPVH